MDDDPIEAVDPLDALLMHADARIHELVTARRRLREQLVAVDTSLREWQHHLEMLRNAQRSLPHYEGDEDDDVPTQRAAATQEPRYSTAT